MKKNIFVFVLGLACYLGANPTGPEVAYGTAEFQEESTSLSITPSDGAIINWQGFSIGTDELTQFFQSSSSASVLNRVVSNNPSEILGRLDANGKVFLINQNGIIVGSDAVINTADFLASTYDISDEVFKNGQEMLFTGSSKASIVNLGNIATTSGNVTLIAYKYLNTGTISSSGNTEIGAGEEVLLQVDGKLLIRPHSSDTKNGIGIENTGTITAIETSLKADGNPYLYAIKNSGRITTPEIVSIDGKIELISPGQIDVSGTITAPLINVETGEFTLATDATLQGQGIDIYTLGKFANSGSIVAPQITIETVATFDHGGTLNAPSGFIDITSGLFLSHGSITVDGEIAGTINIATKYGILESVFANLSATGSIGGNITVNGGVINRLFSSGTYNAQGTNDIGGKITLIGKDIALAGATLNANGTLGGGIILVGGDYKGEGDLPHASEVIVTGPSTLTANALDAGNGGKIIVWSDEKTNFMGSASVNAGANSGDGGLVEVSSKGDSFCGGSVEASAPYGNSGLLLFDPKNITVNSSGTFPQYNLIDPHPGSSGFGLKEIISFPFPSVENNIIVSAPTTTFNVSNCGAVYLFDAITGQLLGSLLGGTANCQVGSGNIEIIGDNTNPGYVVLSPSWNTDGSPLQLLGAATACSGFTGAPLSGTGTQVSSSNSLVGNNTNDQVGSDGITTLTNGDYVVISSNWNNTFGATTFGSAISGVVGTISSANSLIGSTSGDQIGLFGVTALPNNTYVVSSYSWNNTFGAVTFCDPSLPSTTVGIVGDSNSLVGTHADDMSLTTITLLSSGAYVVNSPAWNSNTGAVTFGSTSGVKGFISTNAVTGNSLGGSVSGDLVGVGGVVDLNNGNYVVVSPNWTTNTGAVTFCKPSISSTIIGSVSATNSLVGNGGADSVGSDGVTVLSNNNYVVVSHFWNFQAGAATWGDGTSGVVGPVNVGNSLIGGAPNQYVGLGGVIALNNGNYVVRSQSWGSGVGAVTWGNGSTGTVGTVAAGNSITGSVSGDQVGLNGVVPLSNGHYVVVSVNWNSSSGAVTWANGNMFTSQIVGGSNSIVGSNLNDQIGFNGVTELTNGNYVVSSSRWNSGFGAVTWGVGTAQTGLTVGSGNSIVGDTNTDAIGNTPVFTLSNGNYLVRSVAWNQNRGAVVWGNGSTGSNGLVSATGLIGSNGGVNSDSIGSGGVKEVGSSNYVVISPNFNFFVGAVTWGNGSTGVLGPVTTSNSLVGTSVGDQIGFNGVAVLPNGNYVVLSSTWNSKAGAATWGTGNLGVVGNVDSSSGGNSIVGSTNGDQIGSKGVLILPNADYVVRSPNWNNITGAVTWGSENFAVTGVVGLDNSIVGAVNGDELGQNQVFSSINVPRIFICKPNITADLIVGLQDPTSVTYDYNSVGNNPSTMNISSTLINNLLAQGLNITLQASNDLIINDDIFSLNQPTDLVFDAGRTVTINGKLATNGGNVIILANDPSATGPRDSGSASITIGNIDATGGAQGGNIIVTLENASSDTGNINITAGSTLATNNTGIIGLEARGTSIAIGGDSSFQTESGSISLIAGKNIQAPDEAHFAITAPDSKSVTVLIADDNFPTSPNSGSGRITLSGVTFNDPGTVMDFSPVEIFSSNRGLNTTSSVQINNVTFVPGTLGVDTAIEQWAVWFPDGIPPALPDLFTFYYKTIEPPTPPGPEPVTLLEQFLVDVTQGYFQGIYINPPPVGKCCCDD